MLDQNIILQLQILSDGSNIHEISNIIAAYKGSYWLYKETPNQAHEEIFKEAELIANKKIVELRNKKYANFRLAD